jgi:hypothetical protein
MYSLKINMSKRNKLTILIIFLLAALVVVCLVVFFPKTKQNHQNILIGKKTNDISDWKTVNNANCGLSFKIPNDWTVEGILGESKILSPEDARVNLEFEQTRQALIKNEQGDALLGSDARTLYISCGSDLKAYIGSFVLSKQYKDFSGETTLAGLVATVAFNSKGANPALINTMTVDGQTAYEISYTNTVPGVGAYTNYEMVFERNGKIGEITTGKVTFEQLSETAKDIIKTINFAK